jgi:hypothetical protein
LAKLHARLLASIGMVTAADERLSPSDLDIYRTAVLVIAQHGADAKIHAAMRAHELLGRGNVAGECTWLRIIKAIDVLQTFPSNTTH